MFPDDIQETLENVLLVLVTVLDVTGQNKVSTGTLPERTREEKKRKETKIKTMWDWELCGLGQSTDYKSSWNLPGLWMEQKRKWIWSVYVWEDLLLHPANLINCSLLTWFVCFPTTFKKPLSAFLALVIWPSQIVLDVTIGKAKYQLRTLLREQGKRRRQRGTGTVNWGNWDHLQILLKLARMMDGAKVVSNICYKMEDKKKCLCFRNPAKLKK